MKRIAVAALVLSLAGSSITAQAQSNDVIAGALIGALAGAAIASSIPDQHREPLRQHIVQENRPSYRYEEPRYREEVVVGRELREESYQSYDVPDRYETPGHRYAIINDRPVVYHAQTRRIIHVYE